MEIGWDHPLMRVDDAFEVALGAAWAATNQAEGSGLSERQVALVVRGALLQSWYGLDLDAFLDLVQHNHLFKIFLKGAAKEEGEEYRKIYEQAHDSGVLSLFLQFVGHALVKEEGQNLDFASRVARWRNQHCKKPIFFQSHNKSPVTSAYCEITFKDDSGPEDVDQFYSLVRDSFPQTDRYPGSEIELLDQFSMIRLCRLSADRLFLYELEKKHQITLTRMAPYTGWRPFPLYLETLMNACNSMKPDCVVSEVKVCFYNMFDLADPSELSEYFHWVPAQPRILGTPEQMEKSDLYKVPDQLSSCWNELEFHCGQTDPRHLKVGLVCNPKKEKNGYFVELTLEGFWRRECTVVEVSSIAEKLKELIYVGFHASITQKTEALIE